MHPTTKIKLMDRRVIGVGLAATLCVGIVVLAWSHRPSARIAGQDATFSMNILPQLRNGETLAQFTQRSNEMSRRVTQLDDAAIAAMNAGRYVQAEADARRSIAAGQDSGIAQELLAASLNAQGKDQEAMAAYKVISDRGGVFARNELPYALLLKAGHWRQAVAEYDKVVPPRPDHGLQSTHDELANGGLLRAHNDFSPDVPRPRDLEAAIYVVGVAGKWWGYRGADYQERRLAELRRALALDPASEVVHYYYALGLWDAGKTGEARAAFRQVARASQGDLKSDGDLKAAAEAWLRPRLVMTLRGPDGIAHRVWGAPSGP